MSDDPLSANTAVELFGADALGDTRSLKRAYARLIRAHTPEAAPEAFAHIRQLYEHARATLDAGGTIADLEPADAGDADDGPVEPPAPVLALATVLDIDHAVIAEVGWPALLVGLSSAGAEADAEAIEAALAELPDAPRTEARGRWLGSVAAADPDRGAAMWHAWQPRLDGDAQARILFLSLNALRWGLSVDALRALIDDLRRADHPYGEETAADVSADLYVALSVARAEGDLPGDVLDAIRAGHGRGPLAAVEALRDLAAAGFRPERRLPAIERRHPGVRAALYQMYDAASHHRIGTWAWACTGDPPPAPDPDHAAEAIDRALAVCDDRAWQVQLDGLMRNAPFLWVFAITYGLLCATIGRPDGIATLVFSAWFSRWSVRTWRRRIGEPPPVEVASWRRIFDRCAAEGLWPREVVAFVWCFRPRRIARWMFVDPLLTDFPWLIGRVTDGHVDRLHRLAERAWAAGHADPDDPDDPDPRPRTEEERI